MIDAQQISLDALLETLLDIGRNPWRRHVEIIPAYMPPNPLADTRPSCVVRYTGGEEIAFLRYSKGPKQGHFWDMYGEDYMHPHLALIALLEAPPPPPRFSVTFRLAPKPWHPTAQPSSEDQEKSR